MLMFDMKFCIFIPENSYLKSFFIGLISNSVYPDWSLKEIQLEDLTVLKRSPDLLNNVKIGQDQLWLKMKHILFYGGCGHFGQVT